MEETVETMPTYEKTRQFRESAGIRRLGYVQVMQRLDQVSRLRVHDEDRNREKIDPEVLK